MSESEEKSSRRKQRRAAASTKQRRRVLLFVGLAAAIGAIVAAVVLIEPFGLGGGTGDEDAIESLARRSVEALPAGEYPSLYESFTREFQQRCPRQEFEQEGENAATLLGDDLQFLRFRRVEDLAIQGQNARAVIVGDVAGKPESEFKRRALFRKEDGEWRLVPVADSVGCQAFGLPTPILTPELSPTP